MLLLQGEAKAAALLAAGKDHDSREVAKSVDAAAGALAEYQEAVHSGHRGCVSWRAWHMIEPSLYLLW